MVEAGDLRPGLHLNMLGADGPGKSEASVGAVASCALFCDEWQQASHGGELTAAIEAGAVTRDQVTELGAVLAGDAPGRPGSRVGDAVRLDRARDPGSGGGGGSARGVAQRVEWRRSWCGSRTGRLREPESLQRDVAVLALRARRPACSEASRAP